MSDRRIIVRVPVQDGGDIDIFMDGESGTWRIFLPDLSCADLSRDALMGPHSQLSTALRDIDADPETYNAEIRAQHCY